jgi:hypothetical protein
MLSLGVRMKRLDLWKAKLKAAKAELRIHQRHSKAVVRALKNTHQTINELEAKIENYLAKSK